MESLNPKRISFEPDIIDTLCGKYKKYLSDSAEFAKKKKEEIKKEEIKWEKK